MMRGYDHWKTTEPEPSVELQQCDVCRRKRPRDEISIINYGAASEVSICDDCSECCGDDEEE